MTVNKIVSNGKATDMQQNVISQLHWWNFNFKTECWPT